MTSPRLSDTNPTRMAAGGVPRATLWGLIVVAAAYLGYVALLLACDLLRVAPLGFVAHFDQAGMTAAAVTPGSVAAESGLMSGDRITRANGQVLERRPDWQRVRLNLDPSRPLDLVIERAGVVSTLHLPLTAGLGESLHGSPRPGLLTFRGAQVVTLLLAVTVAFRRAGQPSALLGAWLLASIATISIVLPMRLAAFWHALPLVAQTLLWLPFATSVAIGPLLFAFFAVFPRCTWSRAWLAVALLPAFGLVTWHGIADSRILARPGAATGIPDSLPGVFFVNVTYAAGAVLMLLAHRRAADTLTDRRRIDVLMVGTIVGVTAGAAAVVGYWRAPGADIFATRSLAVLALVFLAVPASFAYAILRHRLFDLSLIVRQGVRYALARRLLDALIPALGALLFADLLLHRQEPLLEVLQSRWWWYTLVGGALVLARTHREQWLRILDRRFFRERYNAQRLLANIAQQISRASSFDRMAPVLVRQLEEALHPLFVDVLMLAPGGTAFVPVAPGSGAHRAEPLPASFTVIGLLAVLEKPLALSPGDPAGVAQQLPVGERDLLVGRAIELLVPIRSQASGSSPAAMLVLGPLRSEEPYNEEDLDLLATVAHALGLLLDRATGDETSGGVTECESCGRCFDGDHRVCTHDKAPLTPMRGARRLNGRYRLDRRLGRGGMGAVYAAEDEALERVVAVKLIRDDVVASMDLTDRFRREARAAAAFAHAHVVRVYDFGVEGDRAFLVMELLEGQTLRQRLGAAGPMAAGEALHVLSGVCTAVSAAHRTGLVHRDLKPENIFLQRHESAVVPKVLDFGLAKAFGTRWTVEQTHGTSAGLLVGTLDYMAPEQAAGDIVSPAWDVWALGVIAYEMLTLSHPFRRRLAFGADGIETECFPDPAETRDPQLSAAAAAFFRRALSSDREVRPRDALAFLEELDTALT